MSVIHVTDKNFEEEVLQEEKKVLVDFAASWCGPCQMLSPIIEEIAKEKTDVKICKVDTDEASELVVKYGIMSVPTLVLFKDGQVVNKSFGFVSKSEILGMLG